MVDLFASDEVFDDDIIDDVSDVAPAAQEYSHPSDKTPITNARLFGQDNVERLLVDLINKNKLPHALIFVGPRGVGKATMAYRLARTLLARCTMAPDTGPGLFGNLPPDEIKLADLNVDESHPVSRQVAAGAHPDLLVLGGDHSEESKSGKILVDEVRRVGGFLSRMPSQPGGWRVVIIDNADDLNNTSQNALLKILEEPPVRTVLILVAHQLGTFLPTIRSRAVDVVFNRIADTDFKLCLQHLGKRISDGDLRLMTTLSGGCPGQVAHIQDVEGLELLRSFLLLWQGWPNAYDEHAWLQFTETVGGQGQDEVFRYVMWLWEWWAGHMLRAKADPARTADFNALLQHPETAAMITHYNLAHLIDICDKLKDHFALADRAALERRQVLYAARAIMIMPE